MESIIVLTSYHRDQTVERTSTNKPEVRHEVILCDLSNSCRIVFPNQELDIVKLKELNVHKAELINYLKGCYSSFANDPYEDYDYKDIGVVPYNFKRNPDHYALTHLTFWKQSGIWAKDAMTPIFEDTWNVALESANNCYCVRNYITYNQKQTIYCLNMYPGHHAGRKEYGGYCFLNNAAICAQTLHKQTNKHIAILDLDYHAGDGTYNIFDMNETITAVSIHADPSLDYPFYDGYSADNFRNKNIIFSPNTGVDAYLQLVDQAMEYINEVECAVLIVAFGGDTFKNDPDASIRCRCNLDIPDYELIGKLIRSKIPNKPIVVTQEGGYDMEHIDQIVHSFLEGLST